MRSGVIVAAFSTMNGPAARSDRRWIARATDLLARPGRAGDHHPAVGRRDLFDQLAQMVHCRRCADQIARLARAFAQLLDLAAELRGLQRPLGDQHQAVGLERLLDVVVGAALDRRNRGLDVAVAGNHDHRQIGVFALDRVEERQPVHAAPLQPDVEEDERRPALGDLGEGHVGIAGGARAVALVGEDAGHDLPDVGFVVDDEDI